MAIDSSSSHKISSVTSLAAFLFLATSRIAAAAQSSIAPGLFITPSTTVLVVGGSAGLSAVDETGRPVSEVQWSISPSVADLREENREVFVVGKEAGRAVLTATANGRTASAAISVVTAETLVGGTVRWSLQPVPGFQTLLVRVERRGPGVENKSLIAKTFIHFRGPKALLDNIKGRPFWGRVLSVRLNPPRKDTLL